MIEISQKQIDRMIYQLAKTVIPQYDYIVGIANGGLHVSKPLARLLKIPHRTIRISHYDGQILRNEPIIQGTMPQGYCLVVDDLIDGGWTMNTMEQCFGRYDTAVLYWKKGSYKPTYFVDYKPDDWLVFPWNEELCGIGNANRIRN